MPSVYKSYFPFIALSFFFMMLITTFGMSGLRVPLMLGHIFLLFIVLGRVYKIDNISIVLVLLIFYFILQYFVVKVQLLYAVQAIIMTVMYLLFYWYSRSSAVLSFTEDIEKLALIAFLFTLPLFVSFQSWGAGRSAGLFENPNLTPHTGLNFLPLILLSRNKTLRNFGIVFAILLVLRSGSRSGLLAIAMGMSFYLLYFNVFKTKLSFAGTFALILGITLVSWFVLDIAIYFVKIIALFASEDSHLLYMGASGRDIIWGMTLDKWATSPWFGVGFGEAKFELNNDGHELGVHNSYLDLLLRTGIIGEALIGLMIILIIYKISKSNYKRAKAAAALHLIILLSLATSSSTVYVFNYYFFYFLITFSISQSKTISRTLLIHVYSSKLKKIN